MTMNVREDEFGVENNLKVLCSIINDTYSSTIHISIKRFKKYFKKQNLYKIYKFVYLI